ncbi:MAG: YbgA family protein [Gemmatimonadota bacterium]
MSSSGGPATPTVDDDAPDQGPESWNDGASEPVRPRVVVSQCLGFAAVRYNGRVLKSRFVEALRNHVDFIQVCPEVEIGLGVPRDPIRIEVERDEGAGASGKPQDETSRQLRLVQPSTGRDLTAAMTGFASAYTRTLEGVDGFILKSKSPSCAFRDSKMYRAGGEGGPIGRGPGLFARAVLEAYPWAAKEDERRLTNPRLRHQFLTHLWALARLRRVEAPGGMSKLVRYHASYEFLLVTLGPDVRARLERIVANPGSRSLSELVEEYRRTLGEALRDPPRTGHTVNALQHVFGQVSEGLDREERAYFLELLQEFRRGRTTLPALLAVLRSWAVRLDREYLDAKHFFEPYPRPLFDLSSSGDGLLV